MNKCTIIARILLIIFCISFIAGGMVLIFTGMLVYSFKPFMELGFTDKYITVNQFLIAPYCLFAIGGVVILLSFIGCCGLIFGVPCLLMTFAVLSFILAVFLLGVGAGALVVHQKFHPEIVFWANVSRQPLENYNNLPQKARDFFKKIVPDVETHVNKLNDFVVKLKDLPSELKDKFRELEKGLKFSIIQLAMVPYGTNFTQYNLTKTWDALQQRFVCCGSENRSQWGYTPRYIKITLEDPKANIVPPSCCSGMKADCHAHHPDVFKESCLDQILLFIESGLFIFIGLGLFLGSLQMIAVVLFCILACVIMAERNEERSRPQQAAPNVVVVTQPGQQAGPGAKAGSAPSSYRGKTSPSTSKASGSSPGTSPSTSQSSPGKTASAAKSSKSQREGGKSTGPGGKSTGPDGKSTDPGGKSTGPGGKSMGGKSTGPKSMGGASGSGSMANKGGKSKQ